MKFKDHESGSEHNLTGIPNCDYWHNMHEELFEVDKFSGYCSQVTGLKALWSILRRSSVVNEELTEEQHLDALTRMMEERKQGDLDFIGSPNFFHHIPDIR